MFKLKTNAIRLIYNNNLAIILQNQMCHIKICLKKSVELFYTIQTTLQVNIISYFKTSNKSIHFQLLINNNFKQLLI